MSFDLVEIWAHMGFLNRLISVSLAVMGLACLTVFFERLIVLNAMRRKSRVAIGRVSESLAKGQFQDIVAVADEDSTGYFGPLLGATIAVALSNEVDGRLSRLERARRELERWQEAFGTKIRRGMNILASTGSVAPFIGLLGTVVGIIVAFKTISMTGSGGISSVAGGISEALVETALGLLVAIPSVLMFNMLSAHMDEVESAAAAHGSKILDLLEEYGYGDES